MTEEQKEKLFDLLTKKAICGLDEAEQSQLGSIDPESVEREFESLEIAAVAISMACLDQEEPMPVHIRERVLETGQHFVDSKGGAQAAPLPPPERIDYPVPAGVRSWFGWLGWAAAAMAAVALAVNIWSTRVQPDPRQAQLAPAVEVQRVLTPAELREELLRSGDVVRATWAAGNVKEIKEISGDVVWSEAKQEGFMYFRGLPANDPNTTSYQLWIFDKTQDKATPIDGGVFNVTADGEIVVPITAKLRAVGPEMFAVTIEKSGGVVVSKREKIAAIAKVEFQAS